MDTFERDGVLALRARRAGGETVQLSANGDKARAIARMFDLGCDASAYSAMEFILKAREWPAWLNDVAVMIDGPKDRPINTENRHVG